jgi:hypothetical protein
MFTNTTSFATTVAGVVIILLYTATKSYSPTIFTVPTSEYYVYDMLIIGLGGLLRSCTRAWVDNYHRYSASAVRYNISILPFPSMTGSRSWRVLLKSNCFSLQQASRSFHLLRYQAGGWGRKRCLRRLSESGLIAIFGSM